MLNARYTDVTGDLSSSNENEQVHTDEKRNEIKIKKYEENKERKFCKRFITIFALQFSCHKCALHNVFWDEQRNKSH